MCVCVRFIGVCVCVCVCARAVNEITEVISKVINLQFKMPGLPWCKESAVKNLPAMQETWLQSLGLEGLLKKGPTTQSSILAWRIS